MTSDEMGNADMTKGKGLNGEQKKKKKENITNRGGNGRRG